MTQTIQSYRSSSHRTGKRISWDYRPFAPLLPGMLFLLGIAVYPTIYSFFISFFRWNLTDPLGMEFGGLHNYELLLSDDSFWHSLFVTLLFVAITVSVELVLGMGIALLFFRKFPGDKFLRALILLPMVVAPVVVGLLWRYILNVNFGVVNYFLSAIGVSKIDFLGDPSWALWTLMGIDVWQWTPFMFLIMLAALQGISEDILEAARMDGANPVQIYFYQMLPLMRYPIAVAVVLRLIDAFRVYDIIFMTTRGGPVDVTQTLSWQIYDAGFRSFDMGYASAYAWLMLVVVLIAVTVMLRIMMRKEYSV